MKKTNRGFTLIELFIVISIISIIATMAIPGILSARRSANAGVAMGNLKAFSTAMATYQNDNENQYYPKRIGDTKGPDCGNYFSHLSIKNGYKYEYYVDGTNADDNTANRGKYIYVAYPTTFNNGRKAYYVDENSKIWENDFSNETSWTAPADATIDFTIIPIVDTTDGKTQTAGPVTILGGTTWIQKS
ncbi:MAG: prepilin-type N-terminal cleavage/methylation domain-containing protein [Planctomycetes bacterium]|nr:prepilin-type N-terminal cleavage/methylation domain-containing protein [Planctomycetota bacterium]HPY75712.1 prepilin-type N-terminal cleavage/methylation domain-containing protein [Planctomycetota bacterium]HQB01261.1 prepilin-type N-terminal cleavage/methylation domain-containing protein [Planctomycetota bacterium]HRU52254.1 prepilin-type N-terminal cleavage/methylation domain-containing protein [Planctomycetota bacterium]